MSTLSRRRFLGSSVAAALGGLATRVGAASVDAQSRMPLVAQPLDDLRPVGPLDEAYWLKVRSQFDLIDGLTFMNNGTLGPVPRVVQDAQRRTAREIAQDPTDGYRFADVDVVRDRIAAFTGAESDEIAVMRSTTEGMTVFARGLTWAEGDEVLMCSHEHFGGKGPYYSLRDQFGITINVIDVPSPPESVEQTVDLYERAITPRTKVIVVSHITYVTGLVMPIKELSQMAHRHGVLVSADGAHPLGMLDLDLHDLECDHYAGAGQKWLLAGTGTGVCYVRKDVADRLHAFVAADMEHETPEMQALLETFFSGAKKFETFGQRHVPSALGMASAIDLQETIGTRNIEARVRQLSERLRAGLQEIPGVKLWTSADPRLSAGLTLFSIHDLPMEQIVKGIMERDRIYIRTMTTGNLNAVRASTHLYNTPEEVDRLLDGVRHVADNPSKYMTA